MKAVIQRVSEASVTVGGIVVGSIGPGLLVFLGIAETDTEAAISKLAEKIINLRIFEDTAGKMNESVVENGGRILVVSQFTLFGDCSKGNRPSFFDAAKPEKAEEYYERFIDYLKGKGLTIATGTFRSHMDISLINDGPVTLLLES